VTLPGACDASDEEGELHTNDAAKTAEAVTPRQQVSRNINLGAKTPTTTLRAWGGFMDRAEGDLLFYLHQWLVGKQHSCFPPSLYLLKRLMDVPEGDEQH
jgi:hypothetical protein